MGLTKRQKEAKKRQLPNYILNVYELLCYQYCVRNNIRISPVAVPNEIGKWRIGISTPDSYKKVYESPEKCDVHSVWEVFNRYTKYYYEKRI